MVRLLIRSAFCLVRLPRTDDVFLSRASTCIQAHNPSSNPPYNTTPCSSSLTQTQMQAEFSPQDGTIKPDTPYVRALIAEERAWPVKERSFDEHDDEIHVHAHHAAPTVAVRPRDLRRPVGGLFKGVALVLDALQMCVDTTSFTTAPTPKSIFERIHSVHDHALAVHPIHPNQPLTSTSTIFMTDAHNPLPYLPIPPRYLYCFSSYLLSNLLWVLAIHLALHSLFS